MCGGGEGGGSLGGMEVVESGYLQRYEGFMRFGGRYAVLYGGAGAGKSYVAAQKVVMRAINEPGLRFLVCRKVMATIRASVFALLWEVVREWGFADAVRIYPGRLVMEFENGSEILCAGLDDVDKLKSVQGIGSVWIEEATELSEGDFAQLELRVRGETVGYKQFVLTFNPTDQGHWLYKRFFEKGMNTGDAVELRDDEADTLVVHVVSDDNTFLDDAYLKHLDTRLRGDANLYRVYGLGQWGYVRRGGAFYKDFDAGRHVRASSYDPALALHISFDFNLRPYMTATVWQIAEAGNEGLRACQIAEFCLDSPRNTTEAVCRAILGRWAGHTAGLFVYGDPSGKTASPLTDGRTHHYTIISRELAVLQPAMRVGTAAPAVAARGGFINAVLRGEVAGLALLIDPTCTNTVADYHNVQEGPEGGKHKRMVREAETGLRWQELGHCSDANDYLLCFAFMEQWRAWQYGGKKLPMAVFGGR
jgi:phage terminase large subunit